MQRNPLSSTRASVHHPPALRGGGGLPLITFTATGLSSTAS
ncbi:hypothetical protein [Streptomyces chartreusis]|nr:hypothetical protein [Streptomyces chartreusis]WSZ71645.1 hypothetical protein OG938_39660 [Streptomyces chartreusis]WUB23750.1 hypothetical protein OG997_04715 [Streptomyces chartreusis]